MAEVVKNRPQELTKAELEIMQVIWQKEKVLVHDILTELPEPKPAYNTVSTIVRILEIFRKLASIYKPYNIITL